MSTVRGSCTPTVSFTQVASLGISPAAELPAAALSLRGTFDPSGALADQCALIHSDTYTFLASTPQTIDLQSLLDIVGTPISFSVVRWFLYRIQSANPAYTITAGGAGTNEWNGLLTSGSKLLWYPSTAANDGYSIVQAPGLTGIPVSSTSRLWKMDPGSNAVGAVDIIIAGS